MKEETYQLVDGRFLNHTPITSPEAVITEFCSLYDVDEVKLMIWKLFKGSVSSKTEVFDLQTEIGDMVFFLENFLLLQMAVFQLSERLQPSD